MGNRNALNGGFQLTSEEAEALMRATAPVPYRADGFYLDTYKPPMRATANVPPKPIVSRVARFIFKR